MPKIPFVGPTYTGRSTDLNAQRCVNWYPQMDRGQGKAPYALVNTPGTVLKATSTVNEVIRGMHVVRSGLTAGERLFVVSGNKLYEYDTDFNETLRGTLSTSTGAVQMADNGDANGDQLLIVDGIYKNATAYGYIFDLDTDAFTTSPTNLDTPTTANFMDGYFITTIANTGKFQWSSLYDGTAWAALDFATSEADPDNIVSAIVDHRELWVFNETSTEIYQNSGDADLPFQRIGGGVIEWGCEAKESVAKADNDIYWLGRNNLGNAHVLRTRGYQAQVISTPAIEYQLGTYSTLTDAIGFCYQQEGNSFYVLTFPTEDRTWVFDTTTELWHERSSFGEDKRWVANCYAFYNNEHLVGDYRNGRIYKLDLDTYTDNGSSIIRLRRSPYISDDLQRIYHRRLQVDFEGGVGLTTGQGSDPLAQLRYSDDGGHTWSARLYAGMGKEGQYETRSIWRQLGSARSRIYELRITDPVKPIVINAHLRAQPGVT